MVLKQMEYNLPGDIPDFGAIFMSNSATKDECLQRNLFGLPAPYNRFVMHVRVGMILFLFEYGKRQLHGVFQACSDGETDIVPHAFVKAAGRRCPSQVKVKQIWACAPLLEVEFADAIKENYVTWNKFSFGLSETQVRRLLHLFSSKVLRPPEKQLKVISVRSSEKVRQVPGSRTKAHDGQRYGSGYDNVGINLREVFEKEYLRLDNFEMEQSKYQSAERARNDTGFRMNENECCEDRARYDGGLMRKNDFRNECYKGDGFAPPVLYDYSLSQSKPNWSSFSENPLEIANSLVPSTTIMSKPSYTDGVSMTVHPNDHADPFLRDYIPLCSDGLQFTAEEYNPDYGVSEKVISSLMHQPSLSYPRNELRDSKNKISSLGNYASFSGPGPSESYGTHMAFHSRDLGGGPSSSKFSLEDVPVTFPISRNNTNENVFSDYTVKADVYPSTNQIEQENQLRYEAAQRKAIKESFLASVASAKCEDPYKFQGPLLSVDPQNLRSYEHNSMEYNPEHYQSTDSFYSDSCKKRTSVFSRLALGSNDSLPENKATKSYDMVDDESISVDVIMNMLQRNHQHWVKPKKYRWNEKDDKKKPEVRENTDEVDVNSPVSSDYEDDVDYSSAGMNQETGLIKTEPFLNFKRRSEKRKLSNVDEAISRVEAVTGMKQRKRKLIRPDFSKNSLSDDSDMKNSTSYESGQRDCDQSGSNLGNCKGKDFGILKGTDLEPSLGSCDKTGESLVQELFSGLEKGAETGRKSEESCSILVKEGTETGSKIEMSSSGQHNKETESETANKFEESLPGLRNEGAETRTQCEESFPGQPIGGTETGNEVEESVPGQHEGVTETANQYEESFPGQPIGGTETGNEVEESVPGQHEGVTETANQYEESFQGQPIGGTETGNEVEKSVPGQHKGVTETANKYEESFPGPRNDGVEAGNRFEEPFPGQHKEGAATGSNFDVAFPGRHKEGTATGNKLEESFLGLHNERTETANKFEESSQGHCKAKTETGVKFEESFPGQEKEGNGTGNKFEVPFPGQHKEGIETGNKLEESSPGLNNEETEMGYKIEESAAGKHKEGTESGNKPEESFRGLQDEGIETVNKVEDSSSGPFEGAAETENKIKPKECKRNAKADSFLPSSQSVDETRENSPVPAKTDEIKSSSDQAPEAQEMPEISYETTPKKRKLMR